MAGAVAQLIERKKVQWSCMMNIFESNCADDFEKINEYLSFVSGCYPESFMDRENTNFESGFEHLTRSTTFYTASAERPHSPSTAVRVKGFFLSSCHFRRMSKRAHSRLAM